SNSSTATGIGAQNTGITVGAGNIIPLSALAEGKVSSAPLVVSHQQQLPAVTVSFNVAPGYSLSEAVRAIQETKDSLDMPTH
ncbi:efflux RND transporter permease subunit, partial [Klebsiella variicola]